MDAADGAVGVEVPLLVGAAVSVPDDDRRTVAGTGAVGVQTLVAEDHQLPAGRVGPALVTATVAIPQLDSGAVGGVGVRHVDASARTGADQVERGAGRRAARWGDGAVQYIEHCVVGGFLVVSIIQW